MKIKKTLTTLLVLILMGGGVYAASDVLYRITNIGGVGFNIPPSQTTKIDEFTLADCRQVTNVSASDLFVPADSADGGDGLAQWRSFYNNVSPSIATISACPSSPPPPPPTPIPSCTILVKSGGLGGDTSMFNIGWGYAVNNVSGATGNCSITGTTNYGSSMTHYLNGSFGPFTASPGSGAGNGPSMWINGPSWSGGPLSSFEVRATITSITCPVGTSPSPANGPGWTVSNTLTSAGTTMFPGESSITIECR